MNPNSNRWLFFKANNSTTTCGLTCGLGHCLIATLLLGLFCTSSWALPSDKEQPIHISADSAKLDQKKRVATYSGNVTLKQGSLEITASQIIVHVNEADKVETMEAKGNPARYQQKPAEDQNTISAQANRILYTLSSENLLLLENAFLEQKNGASISGNRIDYDIRKEIMKAAGKKNSEEKQRIEIVIPPQTINQEI